MQLDQVRMSCVSVVDKQQGKVSCMSWADMQLGRASCVSRVDMQLSRVGKLRLDVGLTTETTTQKYDTSCEPMVNVQLGKLRT